MAKTNDIIENPVSGTKIQFLITAEDSNGEMIRKKIWNKKGAQGPPEHMHPTQIETFEILSGTAAVKLYGKEQIFTAGQSFTVPENAPHTFHNAGQEELVMIVEVRPALRTEFFVESMYALAKQGKVNKKAVPNFLQMMTLLNEYYGEGFLVGPPVLVQKILAKVVGGIGKLFGLKGYLPYSAN